MGSPLIKSGAEIGSQTPPFDFPRVESPIIRPFFIFLFLLQNQQVATTEDSRMTTENFRSTGYVGPVLAPQILCFSAMSLTESNYSTLFRRKGCV